MKGYEAIASAIQRYSSAPAFGVMGNANMLIFATLSAWGDDRLVSARHEAGAVAMADGYARTSGNVGVSTVTSGPGLSQVATSLLAAARYASPQVVITGDAYRRDAARLQAFDQQGFAAACESGFVPVKRVHDIVPAVHEAFCRAVVESRPILLSIPEDLQFEDYTLDLEAELDAHALPQPSVWPVPLDAEVTRLVDALETASRPVFVVGRGCRDQRAMAAVRQLAAHYGALVGTSLPGKGALDDDEWSFGVSGGLSHPDVRPVLHGADLVIGFAAGLGSYTTDEKALYPSARIIRIDVAQTPESLMRGHEVILGEVRETTTRLLAEARGRSAARTGLRTPTTKAVLESIKRPHVTVTLADGLDPAGVAETFRQALPEGALVVLGGGHFWAFPVLGIHGRPDLRWEFSYQFGSIGQTLPVAIGAWYADPARPLVVIDGDGSLLMNIQELDTVARHDIPMTLIVANDGAFGAEVHKLRPAGLPDDVATFTAPDFAAIGTAFGGQGRRVEDLGVLKDVLTSDDVPRPFRVLDVRISREVPSELFKRLYYGGR